MLRLVVISFNLPGLDSIDFSNLRKRTEIYCRQFEPYRFQHNFEAAIQLFGNVQQEFLRIGKTQESGLQEVSGR